jgi:hypothetical protein
MYGQNMQFLLRIDFSIFSDDGSGTSETLDAVGVVKSGGGDAGDRERCEILRNVVNKSAKRGRG